MKTKLSSLVRFMVLVGFWFTPTNLLNAQTYTYDSGGRLTRAVYANGSAATYGYDTVGNLVTITNNAVVVTSGQTNLVKGTDYLGYLSPHPGDALMPTVTVSNIPCSGTSAAAGSFHVGFYWTTNTDTTFANAINVSDVAVAGCPANGSVTLRPSITVSPATKLGTYRFGYKIDDQNEVPECDEANSTTIYNWTVIVTVGPPPVAAKLMGTNMVLSWPTNTTGVLLEYTTNLANKTWVTNTAGFSVMNGQYVITNGVQKGSKFYRLLKP